MRDSAAPREKTAQKSPGRAKRPATVLVVDDEPSVLAETRRLLETFGITVLMADSSATALAALGAGIDLALIDWRLKGPDDGIALGRAMRRDYGIPFVLFSGYLCTDVTVHAMRAGASDVVGKPLHPGRLLAAVEFALAHGPDGAEPAASLVPAAPGSDSLARRWAAMVLRACRSEKDPSTEAAAACAACVSTSTFRKTCDLCDVGARDTRDLIRFVRALSRAKESGSTVRSHLAISDPRTSEKLFERAGLSMNVRCVPLRTFLINQTFVLTTAECLREFAHMAANDPLFFAADVSDEPQSKKKGA